MITELLCAIDVCEKVFWSSLLCVSKMESVNKFNVNKRQLDQCGAEKKIFLDFFEFLKFKSRWSWFWGDFYGGGRWILGLGKSLQHWLRTWPPKNQSMNFFKWHEKPLDFKLDPQKLVKSKKKKNSGRKIFFFDFLVFEVQEPFEIDFLVILVGVGRWIFGHGKPLQNWTIIGPPQKWIKSLLFTFLSNFVVPRGESNWNFQYRSKRKKIPGAFKTWFYDHFEWLSKFGLESEKKNRMGVKGNFSCRLLKLRF